MQRTAAVLTVVLLVGLGFLAMNASEREVSHSTETSPGPHSSQAGSSREVIIRFEGGSSPSDYALWQVVPRTSRRCVDYTRVCEGSFTEEDFQREGRWLVVLAPEYCRPRPSSEGYESRVWMITRDGQTRVAKRTEVTREGASALDNGQLSSWPMCR